MRFLKLLPLFMLLGVYAQAQSPTYGVGRTPTEGEIRAWDISISPTGEELPQGQGTVAEGEELCLFNFGLFSLYKRSYPRRQSAR